MRRRPVFSVALLALALVVFPLVGNLATNSVNIPDKFTPWVWGGLVVLALFAGRQVYLDLLGARQSFNNYSEGQVSIPTAKFSFVGGRLEISDSQVKVVAWGSRSLIIPWPEVRDIRIGVGDDWKGDYADAVALDSCLLAQPLPNSSLLTTNPSMSAYNPRLDRINILNLERAGILRHAVEAALFEHRP